MDKTTKPRAAAPTRKPGAKPAQKVDLSSLFGAATQALAKNQTGLNQADAENHNHGDNMVQTFSLITEALASKQGKPPAQQLQYASKVVAKNASSGSAQVYAQGLAQAAQQFRGKSKMTPDGAMTLIQTLLGGGQAAGAQGGSGGDLLGSLLGGGLAGAEGSGAGAGGDLLGSLLGGGSQTPGSQGGGDMLGTLLGGGGQGGGDLLGSLLGGSQPSSSTAGQAQNGLDLGDLLNAGMSFMDAKQHGQNTLQAALAAVMSAGPMSGKPHREASGQLIANAMLQVLGGLSNRK
jgi:hypothetical protein